MKPTEEQRLQAKRQAEDEARAADMKQHADKIIQRFDTLDQQKDAKRAIWELFQNAIDLSPKCKIKIESDTERLKFSHNGEPFKSKTLISLIKQVSSKDAETNEEQVGQYGTGFLTTHSFGKKFLLDGSIDQGGYFVDIEKFPLDRIARNSSELSIKLADQEKEVFKVIETGATSLERKEFTTFSYEHQTDTEKESAKLALEALPSTLAYVMILNQRLETVSVHISGEEVVTYSKEKHLITHNVYQTTIKINNETRKLYSIKSEDEQIEVILPFAELFHAHEIDKNVAKLFLFYPLIGTEKLGINFIIHARDFYPTEPRDGLKLSLENEQAREKAEHNRNILKEASKLILDFIANNAAELHDPDLLCKADFKLNESDKKDVNEFSRELSKMWIDRFKETRLVDVDMENGEVMRYTPKDIYFLDKTLLKDADYLESLYRVIECCKVGVRLPKISMVKRWSEVVTAWSNEEIEIITIENITDWIEEKGSLSKIVDVDSLRSFYEYLIKYELDDIFNTKKLIPNIYGEFKLQKELVKPISLHPIFVEVAKQFIPERPKKFVEKQFCLSLDWKPYERSEFSTDINAKFGESISTIGYKPKDNKYYFIGEKGDERFESIVKFCNTYPDLGNTGSRGKLMEKICEFYDIEYEPIQVAHIDNLEGQNKQKVEYRSAIRYLLKSFLVSISIQKADWVRENTKLLKEILEITSVDYMKDIAESMKIYPNQNNELCTRGSLKKGLGIPDSLKKLYDEVLTSSKGINSILILPEFEGFLEENATKNAMELASEITKKFNEKGSLDDIRNHPYKKKIIEIVNKISSGSKEEDWKNWFPKIDAEKANIMMATFTNEGVKDDLFSIITLDEDKIRELGDLVKDKDLIHLIQQAKRDKKQQEEEKARKDADFAFKERIGKNLENLIRQKLQDHSENIKVESIQGGQDIILSKDGEDLYYIEVKSRWNPNSRINISSTQMRKAVENKDKYALMFIEMSDYKREEGMNRFEVNDFSEIQERIQVLSNIGSVIEPKWQSIQKVEYDSEGVKLELSYSGVVNQEFLNAGISYSQFVDDLFVYLGKV